MSISWRKGEKKIYNSNGKVQDIGGWYHTAWAHPGIWSSAMCSACVVVRDVWVWGGVCVPCFPLGHAGGQGAQGSLIGPLVWVTRGKGLR